MEISNDSEYLKNNIANENSILRENKSIVYIINSMNKSIVIESSNNMHGDCDQSENHTAIGEINGEDESSKDHIGINDTVPLLQQGSDPGKWRHIFLIMREYF